MSELRVDNLHVSIGDNRSSGGLTLAVPQGEVHAIMGPNGSGKSTLAKVVAGHPDYQVTKGKVTVEGEDVLAMEADMNARGRDCFSRFNIRARFRALRLRIFSEPRYKPVCRRAKNSKPPTITRSFTKKWSCSEWIVSFTSRAVNEGFSGGEKKRTEILQLAMLQPKLRNPR